MHGILESVTPGYVLGQVIAYVIFFLVFAAVVGTGVLVLVLSWRLAFHPRRRLPPRPPSPPDDWDDEEYIARHHL